MKKVFLALILILLVSACVQNSTNTNSNTETGEDLNNSYANTSESAETIEDNIKYVEIFNSVFEPQELTIKTGTTVIWMNVDTFPHTISSANFKKGSGTLEAGETWNYTFDKVETYNYYCAFHFEKGKIIVE